jgi:hypothetical protein
MGVSSKCNFWIIFMENGAKAFRGIWKVAFKGAI